jgi:L-histidine Nalpha-methyltransferase
VTAPLRAPAPEASAGEARGRNAGIRQDVMRGLTGTPKILPAKLFYDELGARLFEAICTLDEYYLTRAELEILGARAGEIAALAGPGCALVEYGSGAGIKVRRLLDALERPAAYVPIDISSTQLNRVSAELATHYPAIPVQPLWADYTRPISLIPLPGDARRLAFFPGSTIGNFHPAEAAAFLRRVRRTIGPDGALVLGVDRRKDARILDAAYDDPAGVTRAFNLNVLTRINRELGGNFDLDAFRHRAFFNADASRVEMHLESVTRQVAVVDGVPIDFAAGETIWTECSYKYDHSHFASLVSGAGFSIVRMWTDHQCQFWVAFLVVRTTGSAS